jgi:transposase
MLYTSNLTEAILLAFLTRLIAKREPKLFWIIDQHPIQRVQRVQQWLAEHKEQIELFYLPSYSLQLNPVEYLNGDVKQGVYSKPPTRNPAQLKQRLISHLRKLQKLPSHIQKYFEHPFIAYDRTRCNLNYCRVNNYPTYHERTNIDWEHEKHRSSFF